MIEVKNLTKVYGQHKAVDNISFTVNDGEILGFLGPNGAGKTTTMNMMTGFISSTSGTVTINGHDILDDPIEAKKQLGYLPDVPPVYGDMRVDEYLEFVCDIKRVKKSQRAAMLDDIAETVGISEVRNRIVKNLSKGYRQRVGLAQAMVGYPSVLILDEPTVGLDPKQIIEMREVIRRLGERHTILLSSHILSEVSAVCDRVMIINNGKIVASDTTENLEEGAAENIQLIRIKGDILTALDIIRGCEGVNSAETESCEEKGCTEVRIYAQKDVDVRAEIIRQLTEKGIDVLMLKSAALTLEDVFIKVVNGEYDAPTAEENRQTDNSDTVEAADMGAFAIGKDDVKGASEDADNHRDRENLQHQSSEDSTEAADNTDDESEENI